MTEVRKSVRCHTGTRGFWFFTPCCTRRFPGVMEELPTFSVSLSELEKGGDKLIFRGK